MIKNDLADEENENDDDEEWFNVTLTNLYAIQFNLTSIWVFDSFFKQSIELIEVRWFIKWELISL